MRTKLSVLFVASVLGLSGCGDTDLERGVTGAAIGGVGSGALGGSVATGALVGGAAGVICDDVDLC